MQSSVIAGYQKDVVVFASSAAGSLVTSPVPLTPSGALLSLENGWPAASMGTGGTAPEGADFNGIEQLTSQWRQLQQAGYGTVPFDATFQAAVGGYPKGAMVTAGASFPGIIYISLVENNTAALSNTTDWQPCKFPQIAKGTGVVTAGSLAISFGTTFVTTPAVQITDDHASTWTTANLSVYGFDSVTTTGCTVYAFQWNGTAFLPSVSSSFNWLAIL